MDLESLGWVSESRFQNVDSDCGVWMPELWFQGAFVMSQRGPLVSSRTSGVPSSCDIVTQVAWHAQWAGTKQWFLARGAAANWCDFEVPLSKKRLQPLCTKRDYALMPWQSADRIGSVVMVLKNKQPRHFCLLTGSNSLMVNLSDSQCWWDWCASRTVRDNSVILKSINA